MGLLLGNLRARQYLWWQQRRPRCCQVTVTACDDASDALPGALGLGQVSLAGFECWALCAQQAGLFVRWFAQDSFVE